MWDNCCGNRNKKFGVKYKVIDRATTRLISKVGMMRKQVGKGQPLKPVLDAKIQSMNELMREINEKFSNKISDHNVLMKIMDAYFIHTQRYMMIIGAINFFFNSIPFILQVYVFNSQHNDNTQAIVTCNVFCIIVACLNLIIEFTQIYAAGGFKYYFRKSDYNKVDVCMCFLEIIYSVWRIHNPHHAVIPEPYSPELEAKSVLISIDHMITITLINALITFFHLFQMFKYLRVIQEFGNIIDLSYRVLSKVSYFIAYYMIWIIVLALVYGELGITIDKDDDHPLDGAEYNQMSRIFKLMIFSYRNSVGDVNVVDTTYWQLFKDYPEPKYNHGKPLIMVFALWFLWFLNNVFMVVILLNFLISIVSKAHDEAIETQQITLYEQKSEQNYEYDTLLKILNIEEKERDLFVIAADFKENDGDEALDE